MNTDKFARRDLLKLAGVPMLAQVAPAGSFTLVEDGGTANAIFVSEAAPPPVVLAAEELRRYVQRMSGAQLAVKRIRQSANLLSIGAAPNEARPPQGEDDAFRIVIFAARHRDDRIESAEHALCGVRVARTAWLPLVYSGR